MTKKKGKYNLGRNRKLLFSSLPVSLRQMRIYDEQVKERKKVNGN